MVGRFPRRAAALAAWVASFAPAGSSAFQSITIRSQLHLPLPSRGDCSHSGGWQQVSLNATYDDNTEKNRAFLRERLGFTKRRMDAEESLRNILTLEDGVLDQRVKWLKKRLKLKEREIKKMTQSQPHILGRLSTNLAPKLDFLRTRLQLSDDESLRKIVMVAPHILCCSIEDNIEPTIKWLQNRFGLDDKAVGKLIMRHPYTLGCSVTENLEPTVEWLKKRLSLDDVALCTIIQRCPQIMHLSVETNLSLKIDWLEERLEMDAFDVGEMIRRSPSILCLCIDDGLAPKLEWIQQRLSLADDELSNLVWRFPNVFSCNVDTNLAPTFEFYVNALEGDEDKARALVAHNPSLFAYSLEKRLKPRLKESRAAGVVNIDASYLRRMGQCSDEKWRSELHNRISSTTKARPSTT